jgi:hypothetical protein
VRRFVVEVRSTIIELERSMLREKSDLKKRDQILKEVKICSLIRLR